MADDENPALKDQEEEEEERRRVCGFTFFQCGLCLLLLLLLGGIGGGVGGVLGTQSTSTGGGGASDTTDAPTSSPTATVVVTATSAPSLPTAMPSLPTAMPSLPTAMPSLHPTSTFLPTSSPVTIGPSVSPSVSPSASPEVSAPSASPSISMPTQGPTDAPTVTAPTPAPTVFIDPVFHHTASSQSLPSGSPYTVKFATEVVNSYGALQFTSDTTYSIPDSGVYVVSVLLEVSQIQNQDISVMIAGIETDKTGKKFLDIGALSITSSTVRYFAAGDDVDVQVLLSNTGRNIDGGYLKIEQVSRGVPAGYTQAIVKTQQTDVYGDSGVFYTIPFDEVTLGSMDATNTTWTAPATGKYLVYGSISSTIDDAYNTYKYEFRVNVDGTPETVMDFQPGNLQASWTFPMMKIYDLTANQTISLAIGSNSAAASNTEDIDVDTQLVIFPIPSEFDSSFSNIAADNTQIISLNQTELEYSPSLVGSVTGDGPFNATKRTYVTAVDGPILCTMTLLIDFPSSGALEGFTVDFLVNGTSQAVVKRGKRFRELAEPSPGKFSFTYVHQNTEPSELSWAVDLTRSSSATEDLDFDMAGQFIEL